MQNIQSAEPFAQLRRRIYLVFCFIGLGASSIGYISALFNGDADAIRQIISFLVIGTFILMTLLALWSRISLARLEQSLFVSVVSLSLITLIYVLYVEYPKPVAQDLILSLLLWFPGVYVMIFFVFRTKRAVIIGSSLLVIVIALSLPHALRTLERKTVFDGITPFVQIYLSHIFIILALYGFAVFRAHAIKQSEAVKAFKELASTDALTGLANRRYMTELLELEFKRQERYEHGFSIIMIDLDKFKQVNDVFGHEAGDQVLTQAANLLKTSLRASDTSSRWGGEEFLILLPETQNSNSLHVAENLRKTIEAQLHYADYRVTVSVGVASFRPEDSLRSLVKRADDALYKAKERGGNQVVNETTKETGVPSRANETGSSDKTL